MDAMVCQDILHSKTKRGLSKVGLGKLSYMLVGAKRILFTRPVKGYLVLDVIRGDFHCEPDAHREGNGL